MNTRSYFLRTLALAACLLTGVPALAQPTQSIFSTSDESLVRTLPGFRQKFVDLPDVRLHYVIGGSGSPVILLPGWPQTWWEFHKVMPDLAKSHTVIAVDLRGMGKSSRPAGGYDKKTMAGDIAAMVRSLGYEKVDVVGHDIGSQVAFAFAANYPGMTRRLVMVDVAHPDEKLAQWPLLPAVNSFGDKVGDGSHAFAWWFAFHQVKGLPEKLMANGRIRIEMDWFFHYLTKDDASIDERSRQVYAAAYRSKDAIRAGDAWYQAFPQDIVDDGSYAKLQMPVLGIGGPGYEWLKDTLTRKATNVRIDKVENTGHFIPEERPDVLIGKLLEFLD